MEAASAPGAAAAVAAVATDIAFGTAATPIPAATNRPNVRREKSLLRVMAWHRPFG
ncbi:hypothetical protein GCM10023317_38480 [Actinopolymorpha pittospori]